MMKALIVEDELIAQGILSRALGRLFDDIEIVETTESVASTVGWLKNPQNKADIIFMDVELQDGSSFEVFRQVDVKARVIMTTAYDKYAIKAFEVGSIDYLLKPIEDDALVRAVSRCRKLDSQFSSEDLILALKSLSQRKSESAGGFKRRHIVRIGQQIIPVNVTDIAYFFIEGKSHYLITREMKRYIVDQQVEDLMEDLDPDLFFRISRSVIISSSAIKSVDKILGGRLKVNIGYDTGEDMVVARSRVRDFLAWLA